MKLVTPFQETKTRCESNEADVAVSSLRSSGQALSAAKDLSPDRDPKLVLRMTKRDGLLVEMYWALRQQSQDFGLAFGQWLWTFMGTHDLHQACCRLRR
jgi:hypothetical protein